MSEEQKPVFDAGKINAQIFSIERRLDEAYNTAIGHAIEAVEIVNSESFYPYDSGDVQDFKEKVILTLQQLKKQPTPVCSICSRIIEEEAHHCEIGDCPHR